MQNGQQEIGWQWVNVGNGPMTIRNVYSKGPINVIVSSTAPPQGERGVPGPLGAMVDMGGAPLEVWSSHTVWIQACNTEPATVDVLLGSPASSSSAGPIEVSNFPSTQKVQPPMPAGFISGQGAVATAGTAVQAYASGYALSNGLIVTASPNNTGTLTVGPAGVNNTVSGTGNGYRLAPGQSMSFAVSNASAVWVNGTASGDTFDFVGN